MEGGSGPVGNAPLTDCGAALESPVQLTTAQAARRVTCARADCRLPRWSRSARETGEMSLSVGLLTILSSRMRRVVKFSWSMQRQEDDCVEPRSLVELADAVAVQVLARNAHKSLHAERLRVVGDPRGMSSSHERRRPTGGGCFTRLGSEVARRSGSLVGWDVGSTRANSRMASASWDPPTHLAELLLPKGRDGRRHRIRSRGDERWLQRRSRSRNMASRENGEEGLRAKNAGRKPREPHAATRSKPLGVHPRMLETVSLLFGMIFRTDARACCSKRTPDSRKASGGRAFRTQLSHLVALHGREGPPEEQRSVIFHDGLVYFASCLLVAPQTDRVTRRLRSARARDRDSGCRSDPPTPRSPTCIMNPTKNWAMAAPYVTHVGPL
jgi:hypothetical protein